MPLIIGTAFSGIAFGVVKLIGYSSNSFMILSYLYVILAFIISLKYEIKKINTSDSILSLLGNIVLVVEGEDMELRKIFTGEKYRVKGEVEKLQ
ncbi:MAG: hypothetical protein ABEJ56_02015 [Candidatus Nanohaloarchaea archaeon]